MKTIIAGSRTITFTPMQMQNVVICSKFNVTEVVSGTARGIDESGEDWAKWSMIPVKRFEPDWEKWGKRAGYKRNEQMAEYANALIAVWDGISKGTRHMISIAKSNGLKVYVHQEQHR